MGISGRSQRREKKFDRIVLASASATRAALMKAAGIAFVTCPAHTDERLAEARWLENGGNARELSQHLAQAKAACVARRQATALTIGADQVLEFDGRPLAKSRTVEEARARLTKLGGATHYLHSSFAIMAGDAQLDIHTQTARLTMRRLSAAGIDDYLDKAGDELLSSVGGYAIESVGLTLFDDISGDYFAILGLPMLALLRSLRKLGAIS